MASRQTFFIKDASTKKVFESPPGMRKKIQKEEEGPRYFGNSLWSGRPSNWSRSRNKWTLLLFQGLLETKTFQTRLATNSTFRKMLGHYWAPKATIAGSTSNEPNMKSLSIQKLLAVWTVPLFSLDNFCNLVVYFHGKWPFLSISMQASISLCLK